MIPRKLIAGLLVFGLTAGATAQVYKSEDAEGNPVFSDVPAAGADAVELRDVNVADPVDVPAPATLPQAQAARPAAQAEPAEMPPEEPHLVVTGDKDPEPKRPVKPRPRVPPRPVHNR